MGASHFCNRNPSAEGGGVANAQSSCRDAEGLFYEIEMYPFRLLLFTFETVAFQT
ncbi:MAG: hypothetical protein J7641_19900 [Cyanobacteria bacterium SID2]|nr:hypothetical protein [Cyanobacteria bacterium SID2]